MPIGRLAHLALVLIALTAVRPSKAEEPYVVRDFEVPPAVGLGSKPAFSIPEVGDRILFIAETPEHGRELWTTDGTTGGTRLLSDLCPGACSSDPRAIGWAGQRLLIEARGPDGIYLVWATNGTWEGTVALGRLPRYYEVGELRSRGLFFYQGTDRGLWVTNGRPGGARPLGSGGPNGPPDFATGLGAGDPRMIFAARRPEYGFEPWVTDGTDAGTRMVADLVPGPADSIRAYDGPVDDLFFALPSATLFFSHADGCVALWRTDGTTAGTRRVRDLPTCQYPMRSTEVVGGALYFVAPDAGGTRQLWRSDGTLSGTGPITSFLGEPFGTASSLPGGMTPYGDAVEFAPDDGVHGREPWSADAAGARMLADICPGPCSSSPGVPTELAGHLYFLADDGIHGHELWASDGTATGTLMVYDACPGPCSSHTDPAGEAGGTVFFRASEGGSGFYEELWAVPPSGEGAERLLTGSPFVSIATSRAEVDGRLLFDGYTEQEGAELWSSDGTPEGTGLLAELNPGLEPSGGIVPRLITPWLDGVFFFANDGDGTQPWKSDGTEAGTLKLGEVVSGSSRFGVPYADPVALAEKVVFLARPENRPSTELWSVTTAGAPLRLLELDDDTARLDHSGLVPVGGEAVLLPVGFESGGVWATDGTVAGTRLLRQLAVHRAPLDGEDVAAVLGDTVLFAASDPMTEEDVELWRTDLTPNGTVQVVDLAPSRSSRPANLVTLGQHVLFTAFGPSGEHRLWRTDGTAAGTQAIPTPGSGPFTGSHPTRVGSRVFFFGDDGLWATDGTAAGTLYLPVFSYLDRPDPVATTVAVGNRFYFIARSSIRSELWVSDGTPAGTHNLEHLWPEEPRVLAIWPNGEKLLVWISTPGIEGLWQTDGSFAGTRRIVSSRQAAQVAEPVRSGPLLFFRGDHPTAGPELMALRNGPPEACVADAETLCLGESRFAVRARWRDPRSGDMGTAGAEPLAGSDRTGLFWFFAPDNIELVVKNLAAGPVNGYFWNFYGALSDVAYTIEVTDTATGRHVEYTNPEGEICGRGDTQAFPARPAEPSAAQAPVRSIAAAGAGGAACGGSAEDLCLLGDRFRVEVTWRDQRSGDTGVGTAIPYADRSGFFWFFNAQNVELVVKIIDGRTVNGRYWVFYGALSDVEYTITVTDTETGQQTSYHNPPGEICGRGDTAAF